MYLFWVFEVFCKIEIIRKCFSHSLVCIKDQMHFSFVCGYILLKTVSRHFVIFFCAFASNNFTYFVQSNIFQFSWFWWMYFFFCLAGIWFKSYMIWFFSPFLMFFVHWSEHNTICIEQNTICIEPEINLSTNVPFYKFQMCSRVSVYFILFF